MKRYFKILTSLVNVATKRYLENRMNTTGVVLVSTTSLMIRILFISIVFNHVSNLNGWSKEGMLMVLGVSQVTEGIFYILFQRSINFLPSYIQKGDLDHILAKPINAQFMISFRYTRPFEVLNVLAGLALFIYALININISFSVLDSALLVINLVLGITILYAIYYSIACLGFWLVNFESQNTIYYMLTSPLSLPTDIYGKTFAFFATYVIPLGLITTVPIKIFLNKIYYFTLLEIFFAVILLIFSNWFWNFSLKHYTSASS